MLNRLLEAAIVHAAYFPPPIAGQPEFHFRGADGSIAQGQMPAEAGADAIVVALLRKLLEQSRKV